MAIVVLCVVELLDVHQQVIVVEVARGVKQKCCAASSID